MKYVELRAKTCFSFLQGASQPAELIQNALDKGLHGLALTDIGGVYGMPKAWNEARKYPQFKFIVGAELPLEDLGFSLTLLSKNRQGYGLLCRLLTKAHADHEKGKCGISSQVFFEFLTTHSKSAEGLFFLYPVSSEQISEAQIFFLQKISSHNLFSALDRSFDGFDSNRKKNALCLRQELQIPIVATNNAHFCKPEDRRLHDLLSSIREGKTLEEMGTKLFSNAERYLKTPEQMVSLFKDLPEAIQNTIRIADDCTFLPSELRYLYPSEWIPAGKTAQGYLEELTWKGAERRYPEGVPENVQKQIRHELALIFELSFADYFLTIWEIIEFAKSKDILCQGRGSAANSVVCYCLEITAIDPVRGGLLFERFISAERGEPPDIDVDFQNDRREEVIQHLYQKYGRDRAAMVCTYITYRTRSAIRDVFKAFGLSPDLITSNDSHKRNETLEKKFPNLVRVVNRIRGIPRHLSIHSGGFTLSAEPIIEVVPVEPGRMEGRTVIQWDKEDLAIIGLLKVDVLALGMLTVIKRTFDELQKTKGLTYSIATLPAEDAETYKMIRRGDTVGVFQIESRAQMTMLKRLQPEHFYDLVIEVALVRPGPIVGQMVHPYLKRRRGLEPVTYPHPKLPEILGRTLGVPLFQEQVMKMAIVLAGFTPGEADELRRAIGAWRSSGSIEKVGHKLMAGLLKAGLPQEFVDRIFLQIKGFSEYGFPESHAASFALIAYASSYLKCHYPAQFLCASLNSQPMGFYSPHTLVEDAKRHGVEVLPVNPHHSEWECTTVSASSIQIGLNQVLGLREDGAKHLLNERHKKPFESLRDFIVRTELQPKVLYRMALGDAFSCFGVSQRHALWQVLGYRQLKKSLFEGLEAPASQLHFFKPLTFFEAIEADHQMATLSTRGHPLEALRPALPSKLAKMNSKQLLNAPAGSRVEIAGLTIVRQRPSTAKGTMFATLEDEFGFADLIVRAELSERYLDVFLDSPFVVAKGRVQTDRLSISILVESFKPLSAFLPEKNLQKVDETYDSRNFC